METEVNDPPAETPAGDDEECARALRAISGEHPGWSAWAGVATLLYARRALSTPPLVVRSATLDGLRKAIEEVEK